MKETSLGGSRRTFEPTAWTVVLRARDRKEAGALIKRYWKPCYFFLRRRGIGVEDAKDLTQGFFAEFLERNALARVAPAKGKFRSFLLACLEHFLSNEYHRRRAKKRSAKLVPLDLAGAEEIYAQSREADPEAEFRRQWAFAVVDRAAEALRASMGERFELVRGFLLGGGEARLRDLAIEHGVSESNAKVILHRARKRFRDLLRQEVAETLEDPREAEDELRELLRAL